MTRELVLHNITLTIKRGEMTALVELQVLAKQRWQT